MRRTIVMVFAVGVLSLVLSAAAGAQYVGDTAPAGPGTVGTQSTGEGNDDGGASVLGEQFAPLPQVAECTCGLPWWVPVGLIGLTAMGAAQWFLLLGLWRRKKEEEQEAATTSA